MLVRDIALKVAEEQFPHLPEEVMDYAEALVAEIQRRGEPDMLVSVYPVPETGGVRAEINAFSLDVGHHKLFTFPPSIEALEDKVAEACAAYLSNRAKPNLEAAQVMDYSVAAIRSGEWKKFRKGE